MSRNAFPGIERETNRREEQAEIAREERARAAEPIDSLVRLDGPLCVDVVHRDGMLLAVTWRGMPCWEALTPDERALIVRAINE